MSDLVIQSWNEQARRTMTQVQLFAGLVLLGIPVVAFVLWLMTSGAVIDPLVVDVGIGQVWLVIALGVAALVGASALERRSVAAGSDTDDAEVLRRYRSARILGALLREFAVGSGLVVGLLGKPLWGYALLAVVLVVTLATFPRRSDLPSGSGEAVSA